MADVLHAPPGRAGRLWLQHRLRVARQGTELLDHKLRILRTERERLALQQERTAAAWRAAAREADTWLRRAVLLGGERAVRLGAEPRLAEVEVVWEQPMGVRHPAVARCSFAEPSPDVPAAGSAALVVARDRHRRAVEAAVRHAVVEAAMRILEAEERATRRRLRAIEDSWIPRLDAALAEVELGLDEEEHADGVRLRWAAARQVGPGRAGRAADHQGRGSP